MKKLKLDHLTVESFNTSAVTPRERGTVAGHVGTREWCPVSYGGTCWITCWDSCYCETEFEC